jgi:hypothetical protein
LTIPADPWIPKQAEVNAAPPPPAPARSVPQSIPVSTAAQAAVKGLRSIITSFRAEKSECCVDQEMFTRKQEEKASRFLSRKNSSADLKKKKVQQVLNKRKVQQVLKKGEKYSRFFKKKKLLQTAEKTKGQP